MKKNKKYYNKQGFVIRKKTFKTLIINLLKKLFL